MVANVYMGLGRFLYPALQHKKKKKKSQQKKNNNKKPPQLYNKPLSLRSHTSFPIQIGLGRGRDARGRIVTKGGFQPRCEQGANAVLR